MKQAVFGVIAVIFATVAFPALAQESAQSKGLTEWNSFTQQQKDKLSNIALFAFVEGYREGGAALNAPTGDFAKASQEAVVTMFEGYVNLAFNAHPSYTLRDALVYAVVVTLTAGGVLPSKPSHQK